MVDGEEGTRWTAGDQLLIVLLLTLLSIPLPQWEEIFMSKAKLNTISLIQLFLNYTPGFISKYTLQIIVHKNSIPYDENLSPVYLRKYRGNENYHGMIGAY